MEKYAPPFSKVLLTPDPHYIPGYTGYCPQMKFNVGKTYGQLTAELLTRRGVKPSSCLVLHPGHVPSVDTDTTAVTVRSIPDSNLKKVIPGYTGFIPRSQNYFSCSYSEVCHKALTEFYQEGRAKMRRQSTNLPVVVSYTNQQLERPKRPLTAISKEVISYEPLTSFSPCGKPYFMEDDNPHKYFISGYTGHVPKSRFLIGKGYPILSKQALIQFGKEQRNDTTSQDIPGRKDSATLPLPTIYSSNMGMVPSYTGHIPGYQFMFGRTYGQLSQNALEKSGIKRSLREKP